MTLYHELMSDSTLPYQNQDLINKHFTLLTSVVERTSLACRHHD